MIQVFSKLDIINVQFSFSENGLGKNNQGFYIYYRFSYLKTKFQLFVSVATEIGWLTMLDG